jgi:hypothetical protein
VFAQSETDWLVLSLISGRLVYGAGMLGVGWRDGGVGGVRGGVEGWRGGGGKGWGEVCGGVLSSRGPTQRWKYLSPGHNDNRSSLVGQTRK